MDPIHSESAEVSKLLGPKNVDVIVDIKVSNSRVHDSDLIQQGYSAVLPDSVNKLGASTTTSITGSFGKGQSIWIWKRKQGTCGGRLRPIVDIQLDKSDKSSALVLSGYICLLPSISGQWVWIKRAIDDEEEKDAIVELYVTVGNMKSAGDAIWSGAGVGWIRVDGNFSKSMLSSVDSFLWFRPARTRSMDLHLSSPVRYH